MAQDVVGSKMPPYASDALKPDASGYGQNGFGGPSSYTPGQKTVSGFMPQTDIEKAVREAVGGTDARFPADASGKMHTMKSAAVKPQPLPGPQTRTVGANVGLAHGMDTRSPRGR